MESGDWGIRDRERKMAEKKKLVPNEVEGSKLDQILEKVTGLEADVGTLKTDVGTLKTDMSSVKAALGKQSLKLLDQDLKFEAMNKKIDQKFDEVLTGQDKIIDELEKSREDRNLAKKKDDNQDREIDGLQKRIKVIEDKVLV